MLCVVFRSLLREADPEVAEHITELGIEALDFGFPWLFSAFVNHLPVSELLLLWDRVVGFDSLLPLAVLGVAVVVFRRELILATHNIDDLMDTMEDLSQVRVVPLLQGLLFDS